MVFQWSVSSCLTFQSLLYNFYFFGWGATRRRSEVTIYYASHLTQYYSISLLSLIVPKIKALSTVGLLREARMLASVFFGSNLPCLHKIIIVAKYEWVSDISKPCFLGSTRKMDSESTPLHKKSFISTNIRLKLFIVSVGFWHRALRTCVNSYASEMEWSKTELRNGLAYLEPTFNHVSWTLFVVRHVLVLSFVHLYDHYETRTKSWIEIGGLL